MCESTYCNESETTSKAFKTQIKLAEAVLDRAVSDIPGRAGKKVSKTYNAGNLITPELRKTAVIEALNLYNKDYGKDNFYYLSKATYNRVTSLIGATKFSGSHVDSLVDALKNYVLREAEFALRCPEGRVGEYENVLNMSGSEDFWTGRILACESAQERKNVYDEVDSIDYIAFHRWGDVARRLGTEISLSDFAVDDYDFIVRYDDYGSPLNELFERAMDKGDDDVAARLNAGIKEYPYAMHYNANEVLPFIDKYPTPGNADTAINLLLGDYKEGAKKRKDIVDELLKHVERKPNNYSTQDEYDERADGFAVAAKILEVFINESASSVQFARLLETSLFKEDNYKRVVNFLQDSDIVSDGLLLPLLDIPAIRAIAVELPTTSNKVLHYINVMETWLKDDVTRVKIAAHPNADVNLLAVHAAGEYGEEATLAAINNPNLPIERAINVLVDKTITPQMAVAVATRPDALPAHILILIAQGDTDVTNALLEHPSTQALVKAYLPTRKK